MKTTYEAHAHREGAWWAIAVPAVEGVFSQARRIDQVEAMARDAVAGILDIDPESFDVAVIVRMPPEWEAAAAEVSAARAAAEAAEAVAGAKAREVARRLHDAGLPVRDVGKVLGVSAQRISQLLNPRPLAVPPPSDALHDLLPETGEAFEARRTTDALGHGRQRADV